MPELGLAPYLGEAVRLTIRNSGLIVVGGVVSLFCPDFEIISGSGPFLLDPGDSLDVSIRFRPSLEGNATCVIGTGVDCDDVMVTGAGIITTTVSFATQFAKRPEEVVLHAVKDMLPRGTLGRQRISKLKVYKGTDHPHAAQKPKTLEIK